MTELCSPDDIPRVFNIPMENLFGGLKYLFSNTANVDQVELDAQAFTDVFLKTAIGLVEKTISYQTTDYEVMETLQRYQIPYDHYHSLTMNLSILLTTASHQLESACEALRYHYVVDTSYQLVNKHTLQVKLHCTEPSRNLKEVLRIEIEKARERNEFVPYKYLHAAGLD